MISESIFMMILDRFPDAHHAHLRHANLVRDDARDLWGPVHISNTSKTKAVKARARIPGLKNALTLPASNLNPRRPPSSWRAPQAVSHLEMLPPELLAMILQKVDTSRFLPTTIAQTCKSLRAFCLERALDTVTGACRRHLTKGLGATPFELAAHRFVLRFLPSPSPESSALDFPAPMTIDVALKHIHMGAQRYLLGEALSDADLRLTHAAYVVVKTNLSFVRMQPGMFSMGRPVSRTGVYRGEAEHDVVLTRPFLLQTTPVTQREWQALMGNNPSYFASDTQIAGYAADRPVERVSWFDAVAFCNEKSRREGLTPCYDLSRCTGTPGRGNYSGTSDIVPNPLAEGYRLPTEAEWEYAARAGTTGSTYAGETQKLEDIAWNVENSGSTTHPVGEKTPNPWGLYDMLGQVREWVQDKYDTRYGRQADGVQIDPQGPTSGNEMICRGGSFGNSDAWVTASCRNVGRPYHRDDNIGFRVARSCALAR